MQDASTWNAEAMPMAAMPAKGWQRHRCPDCIGEPCLSNGGTTDVPSLMAERLAAGCPPPAFPRHGFSPRDNPRHKYPIPRGIAGAAGAFSNCSHEYEQPKPALQRNVHPAPPEIAHQRAPSAALRRLPSFWNRPGIPPEARHARLGHCMSTCHPYGTGRPQTAALAPVRGPLPAGHPEPRNLTRKFLQP